MYISGAKSITLSGGSFRRKIDIVPANWYDNKNYQQFEHEFYRDVQILDKSVPNRITNSPFRYMHEIDAKDLKTQGGTKKAIRMLKNIKNDSEWDIQLTSYDIASLIWNMSNEKLNIAGSFELGLLANVQEYLDYLYNNPSVTISLFTPDHSRKIIDTTQKQEGLKRLSYEVDELSKAIHKEFYPQDNNTYFSDIRQKFLAKAV